MNAPELGKLISGEAFRDAIHIAVAPVTAAMTLYPSQRVSFTKDSSDRVELDCGGKPLGIVDPFLDVPVGPGERFYMFLFPNTITSLRHEWTHPAFKAVEASSISDLDFSKKWLEVYAAKMSSYDDPAKAYENLVEGLRSGELFAHGSDLHSLRDLDNVDELKSHAERVLGIRIDWDNFSFSCSC